MRTDPVARRKLAAYLRLVADRLDNPCKAVPFTTRDLLNALHAAQLMVLNSHELRK